MQLNLGFGPPHPEQTWGNLQLERLHPWVGLFQSRQTTRVVDLRLPGALPRLVFLTWKGQSFSKWSRAPHDEQVFLFGLRLDIMISVNCGHISWLRGQSGHSVLSQWRRQHTSNWWTPSGVR